MSNCYLCDTCGRKAFDWSPSEVFCHKEFGFIAKLVMHDGAERPTDVCEHYVEREADCHER